MTSTEQKKPKGLLGGVYEFLASIKLSIFVLMALALTSIVGTLIQQGREQAVYVKEYGEGFARVIVILNLGDMYHSWWFLLLLTLLLLNITMCSIRRLPHALRLMRDRDPVFDGRPVAIHERWEHTVRKGTLEDVTAKVEAILSEKAGHPLRQDVDAKTYFFTTRGGWTRMGVYVTHASLFLFAAGAFIGGVGGFKGFVEIPEGSSVREVPLRSGEVKPLDFEVRCDNFELQSYPDGRPKDYKSKLTVIENGREVLTKTIEVNDPLIYKGIYFYQSSYGAAGAGAAVLSVYGPRRNLLAHQVRVDKGASIALDSGYALRLMDLTTDYQGSGPAVLVRLEKDGQPLGGPVIAAASRPPAALGENLVALNQIDTAMFTGLQVAKDPGVPVIWVGCVLITLGLLVAFFGSHRRVWARVARDGASVKILFAGNASRNRIAFERRFEELVEYAQESFEK